MRCSQLPSGQGAPKDTHEIYYSTGAQRDKGIRSNQTAKRIFRAELILIIDTPKSFLMEIELMTSADFAADEADDAHMP